MRYTMGSPGVGGTISAASDVALNNPTQDDLLLRDTGYWRNIAARGKVALATSGGAETLNALGSGSGTPAINLASGNVVSAALAGNTSFTFSGAIASTACSFGLYITQDGTVREIARSLGQLVCVGRVVQHQPYLPPQMQLIFWCLRQPTVGQHGMVRSLVQTSRNAGCQLTS